VNRLEKHCVVLCGAYEFSKKNRSGSMAVCFSPVYLSTQVFLFRIFHKAAIRVSALLHSHLEDPTEKGSTFNLSVSMHLQDCKLQGFFFFFFFFETRFCYVVQAGLLVLRLQACDITPRLVCISF
jgi:hypothetical protein